MCTAHGRAHRPAGPAATFARSAARPDPGSRCLPPRRPIASSGASAFAWLGEAPLYQRNANLLLHPASNMKLVTLAAAAERLGWDFRFPTTIRSTTPVEPDGTLRGDLVVIGGGDPTIGRPARGRGDAGAGWRTSCGGVAFDGSRDASSATDRRLAAPGPARAGSGTTCRSATRRR